MVLQMYVDIIALANLEGPHIGDGGALIFNSLKGKIIARHLIDKNTAKSIINVCVANGLHISAHTVDNLFIDRTHPAHITEKRKIILRRDLVVVETLETHIDPHDIIKLTVTVQNDSEKKLLSSLIEPFKDSMNLIWSHHPVSLPWQYAIISAKGVSKASASQEVAKSLGMSMDDVLGIGDTLGDWIFMKECGYVGVVGDVSPELINLAKTKGEGNYCNASSVDENGMIEILKHFKVI